METLAGTGIRVSELPFITVESLAARRTTVSLKGKTRTVLLNRALCKKQTGPQKTSKEKAFLFSFLTFFLTEQSL